MERSLVQLDPMRHAPPVPQHARRVPVVAFPPIVRHLDADGGAAVEPGMLFFARGDVVFERGAVPSGMYFVIDGAVQLVAEGADGRDKVVELFGPGDMFGEIGVFVQGTYQAEAQAVSRTTLIHVDRAQVLSAVANDGELAARMLREVSRRVEKLISGIRGSSSNHAGDRVANYLLQLARKEQRDACEITLPAPKGTVASLLGLTPETFSRILRRFHDDGLIVMRGRTVQIPDVDRLATLRCSGD